MKRNIERYFIDYTKAKIKDPSTPAEEKFRVLLLLKDMMEKQYKSIIDYNEKRLLKRLFLLAKSPQKDKVLRIYDKKADLKYSQKFYTLLLECLDNWGLKYGSTNPEYMSKRKSLIESKLLPVPRNYYNIPGDQDENESINYNDVDQLSLG